MFGRKKGIGWNFALNRNWLLGIFFLLDHLPSGLKSEIRCAMRGLENIAILVQALHLSYTPAEGNVYWCSMFKEFHFGFREQFRCGKILSMYDMPPSVDRKKWKSIFMREYTLKIVCYLTFVMVIMRFVSLLVNKF